RIHSPKTCLPGGGWEIQKFTVTAIEEIEAGGAPLRVIRVLMQKEEHQQLVYYWFQGRGRNITNEYMAKWYIFWDSITRNRTDGALVRLVTYVPKGSEVGDAEARLNAFLADFYQLLPEYIPD
ncbi:MAG: EpsI family protein, partial [Pseudomonadales bacterium]|nr:EpsI family protein [Pseudomonadales bacterium]